MKGPLHLWFAERRRRSRSRNMFPTTLTAILIHEGEQIDALIVSTEGELAAQSGARPLQEWRWRIVGDLAGHRAASAP